MKKLIVILFMSISCLYLMAQNNQGKIVFTEKVTFEIDLGEDASAFQGKLPNSQEFKRVLYFNEKESIYKESEEAESTEDMNWSSNDGGRVMKIQVQRPENIVYKNIKKEEFVELKEFMGKKFLVEDEFEKPSWKLGAGQKEILGFPCTNATYQDTSKTVEAWFTSKIPVSNGPQAYGQLPGMILEVNVNDGERIYMATSIDTGEMEEEIKAPKGGKKVTRAEFEQIRDEKIKEMDAEVGSGGTIKIIRRN